MKSSVMNRMREWGFPVIVLATWFLGFAFTLMRLGEAHRTHSAAAVAAQVSAQPVPATPYVASAE
jgi:hypothetical protein